MRTYLYSSLWQTSIQWLWWLQGIYIGRSWGFISPSSVSFERSWWRYRKASLKVLAFSMSAGQLFVQTWFNRHRWTLNIELWTQHSTLVTRSWLNLEPWTLNLELIAHSWALVTNSLTLQIGSSEAIECLRIIRVIRVLIQRELRVSAF